MARQRFYGAEPLGLYGRRNLMLVQVYESRVAYRLGKADFLGQHLDRWRMSTRPRFHVPRTILTVNQVQFILRKRQPLGSDFAT